VPEGKQPRRTDRSSQRGRSPAERITKAGSSDRTGRTLRTGRPRMLFRRKARARSSGTGARSLAEPSTNTHQRIGGGLAGPASERCGRPPRASRRSGCRASKPSSRHLVRGGATEPGRTGQRLEYTSAHRVAAQALHRPPARGSRPTGGASPLELALQGPSLRDGVGGRDGDRCGRRAQPATSHCHSSATGDAGARRLQGGTPGRPLKGSPPGKHHAPGRWSGKGCTEAGNKRRRRNSSSGRPPPAPRLSLPSAHGRQRVLLRLRWVRYP
jgi:hypothetical protein